jgi:hypothetical protein
LTLPRFVCPIVGRVLSVDKLKFGNMGGARKQRGTDDSGKGVRPLEADKLGNKLSKI